MPAEQEVQFPAIPKHQQQLTLQGRQSAVLRKQAEGQAVTHLQRVGTKQQLPWQEAQVTELLMHPKQGKAQLLQAADTGRVALGEQLGQKPVRLLHWASVMQEWDCRRQGSWQARQQSAAQQERQGEGQSVHEKLEATQAEELHCRVQVVLSKQPVVQLRQAEALRQLLHGGTHSTHDRLLISGQKSVGQTVTQALPERQFPAVQEMHSVALMQARQGAEQATQEMFCGLAKLEKQPEGHWLRQELPKREPRRQEVQSAWPAAQVAQGQWQGTHWLQVELAKQAAGQALRERQSDPSSRQPAAHEEQIELLMQQELQEGVQAAQALVPLTNSPYSPHGHRNTQVLPLNRQPAAQDRQRMLEFWQLQVTHGLGHVSQCPLVLLAKRKALLQAVRQALPSRKQPATQVRQLSASEQVRQGDTQAEQEQVEETVKLPTGHCRQHTRPQTQKPESQEDTQEVSSRKQGSKQAQQSMADEHELQNDTWQIPCSNIASIIWNCPLPSEKDTTVSQPPWLSKRLPETTVWAYLQPRQSVSVSEKALSSLETSTLCEALAVGVAFWLRKERVSVLVLAVPKKRTLRQQLTEQQACDVLQVSWAVEA